MGHCPDGGSVGEVHQGGGEEAHREEESDEVRWEAEAGDGDGAA